MSSNGRNHILREEAIHLTELAQVHMQMVKHIAHFTYIEAHILHFHKHDDRQYLVLYLPQGTGILVKGSDYTALTDSCTLTQSYISAFSIYLDEGCEVYVALLTGESIQGYIKQGTIFQDLRFHRKTEIPSHSVFQSLGKYHLVDEYSIDSSVLRLYSNLHYQLHEVQPGSMKQEMMDKAVSFIEQNYRRDIGLKDTSEAGGYSEHYFLGVFREVMRMTPYGYLIRKRLLQVKILFLSTGKTIEEIALEYGSKSDINLYKTFKNMYSIAPGEYKKCVGRGWGSCAFGNSKRHYQKGSTLISPSSEVCPAHFKQEREFAQIRKNLLFLYPLLPLKIHRCCAAGFIGKRCCIPGSMAKQRYCRGQRMKKGYQKSFDSIFILPTRCGLTLAILFLILGSPALLLSSFPLDAYQPFLTSFHHGALPIVFNGLYEITLNSLALILIITVTSPYRWLHALDDVFFYPVVAMASYLAFCGGMEHANEIFHLGWAFTTTCITMLSCWLFHKGMHCDRHSEKLHIAGVGYTFNKAIQGIFPIAATAPLFAVIGAVLHAQFGEVNITSLGAYSLMGSSEKMGKGLPGALLYVFFAYFLWFFGIHGIDTLQMVAKQSLEPGILINQQLVQARQLSTEIFTKTFLDTFVFMRGCGAVSCLASAMLLKARKSNNRKLAKIAGISVLFNINETVIFGFPVIFNPLVLLSFLLVPLVLTLTSAFAMQLQLVPLSAHFVGWVVPVLMNGYEACGSASDSLLQLFNLILGTLLYIPFIRLSGNQQSEGFETVVRAMETDMAKGEANEALPDFLDNHYLYHFPAKIPTIDLKNTVQRNQTHMHCQIQRGNAECIHGAEVLLRWEHPVAGRISSPLMIKLVEEGSFLDEPGLHIIKEACKDAQKLQKEGASLSISVNISPKQLENAVFVREVRRILQEVDLHDIQLIFEVMERSLLSTSGCILERIRELKQLGIRMSMDDFGMGHSSMMYLQENAFDEAKLDGNLVCRILENERSRDIVRGITRLVVSTQFHVAAEFAETREQMELPKALYCDTCQGYYYGKPCSCDEFIIKYLKQEPRWFLFFSRQGNLSVPAALQKDHQMCRDGKSPTVIIEMVGVVSRMRAVGSLSVKDGIHS